MAESIHEAFKLKEAGCMDVSIRRGDDRRHAANLLCLGWGVCIDETSANYREYARILEAREDGMVRASYRPRTSGVTHGADFEPVGLHDLPDGVLDYWFG